MSPHMNEGEQDNAYTKIESLPTSFLCKFLCSKMLDALEKILSKCVSVGVFLFPLISSAPQFREMITSFTHLYNFGQVNPRKRQLTLCMPLIYKQKPCRKY